MSWSVPRYRRGLLLFLLVAASALAQIGEVHRVQRGDSLDEIARKRYGHRIYGKLVGLHNGVTAQKLEVGTELKLPELKELLRAEKLGEALPEVTDAIVQAVTVYRGVEPRLWEWRRSGGPVAAELQGQVLEAADALDRAVAGLSASRPEIVEKPKSFIGQLRDAAGTLRSIAAGKVDPEGYDLDMVHQRIGLALSYGVVWGRNGFR